MTFSVGRRGKGQVVSDLGKDALSALDNRGREDCSDEPKTGQLVAPVLNNRQHVGDAVFGSNQVGCNPEAMGYRR